MATAVVYFENHLCWADARCVYNHSLWHMYRDCIRANKDITHACALTYPYISKLLEQNGVIRPRLLRPLAGELRPTPLDGSASLMALLHPYSCLLSRRWCAKLNDSGS